MSHSYQDGPARWPVVGIVLQLIAAGYFLPAAQLIPDYHVGDTARVDIVTPVPLMVVDHAGTEALRLREAQKIPAIYRYVPSAVNEAEAHLRGTWAFTREDFMEKMEMAVRQRQVGAAFCARPQFRQFVNSWRSKNKVFPMNTNLAQMWATGQPDEALLSQWVTKLREPMQKYIRNDGTPPEAKIGPPQVRLLAVPSTNAPVSLELAEKASTRFYRTNFITLFKLRKEFLASFPPEEAAVGRFLSLFLRENCYLDLALTRQSRAAVSESIWAADSYQPGEVLVKKGEVITAKVKNALDQLKGKMTIEQMKVQEQLQAQASESQARQAVQLAQVKTQERHVWMFVGLALGLVAALWSLWRVTKVSKPSSLLPAPVGRDPAWIHTQGDTTLLSCPACAETIIVDLPTGKSALLNPGTAPGENERDGRTRHLPMWLQRILTKGMRNLLWQRNVMLDTERLAEMEVAALEKRLTKMHAPLQERIQAYERRVSELERELAMQQQQNSELILAQIHLAKQRLEQERLKAPGSLGQSRDAID